MFKQKKDSHTFNTSKVTCYIACAAPCVLAYENSAEQEFCFIHLVIFSDG